MVWSRAIAVVLALPALAACADDGRELRPPPPGATAPAPPISTSTTSTSTPVSLSQAADGMVLTSSAFGHGEPIPSRHSCSGGNVSPPLAWSGVPAGTVELAVVVIDLDADNFVHWVIAGLDPSLAGLEEDARPEGAVEARNDSSEFGWFGPCPPDGERHVYAFTLYALLEPSGVTPASGGADAIAAIAGAPGSAVTLTGTFEAPDG